MTDSGSERSCTCGRCFEGWLSPRMRERLEYSTELRYGLAKSLLDTQDGVSAEVTRNLPIDYAHIDVAFFYLPDDLRAKISPSSTTSGEDEHRISGDAIYRGYVAVFEVIKDLATASESSEDDSAPRGFPTLADVTKRLSEHQQSIEPTATSGADADAPPPRPTAAALAAYLAAGGTAAPALDCIVDRAREELSPLGRLYDAEKQYIDAVLDAPGAPCANDLDFARVRAGLGVPELETRASPVGLWEGEEDGRDLVSDDEE
ncbi:hypothetical protein C8Q79DRAFT_906597 [Trametes meyenii]|nr:hypothetical protein C8Q79DRAFT_906597 [Trametes meyenii]